MRPKCNLQGKVKIRFRARPVLSWRPRINLDCNSDGGPSLQWHPAERPAWADPVNNEVQHSRCNKSAGVLAAVPGRWERSASSEEHSTFNSVRQVGDRPGPGSEKLCNSWVIENRQGSGVASPALLAGLPGRCCGIKMSAIPAASVILQFAYTFEPGMRLQFARLERLRAGQLVFGCATSAANNSSNRNRPGIWPGLRCPGGTG